MSASRFLSAEWLDLLGARLGRIEAEAGADGVTALVEFVITKGPDGEVRWSGAFENGSLGSTSMGAAPNADLALTTVYPDAMAIVRGELDLNTAFMQGRMKVAGPTGPLLALIALSQSTAHRTALDEVLAETSF